MSDENKQVTLVSIESKRKEKEEDSKEYLKHVMASVDKFKELVDAGEVSHMCITYETEDGGVSNILAGLSSDYYRMLYILEKITPENYYNTYMVEYEEED